MFGDPFHIRYLEKHFKLFDFVGKFLQTDISNGIPCLFYFSGLALVLRARAVTNPFPSLSNSTSDSEDVVSVLFRSSNFSEIFKISYIFKVTHLALPFISLCFLTLRRPQFSCSQTQTNLVYL